VAPLLKLVAVPHKVMAEHGHTAAAACFAVAQSHRVAARLAEAVAEKRAPVLLRARCADYLRGALADWSDDALAREPEVFEAAIAAGSVDASADVRARGRGCGAGAVAHPPQLLLPRPTAVLHRARRPKSRQR
jgi:hypothetical protein